MKRAEKMAGGSRENKEGKIICLKNTLRCQAIK
jgi:hypothetical protein